MIGVVGLVAIAGILAAVVATSTIQALGQTSATRAGVQAQAAADAGVEFARALIEADDCTHEVDRDYGDIYSSSELAELSIEPDTPYFETTVQYNLALSGTWSPGCPEGLLNAALNYQVRIESTGYAESPGVGVSALDEHTVEAVFGWSILAGPAPTGGIRPSGAAVYAFTSQGFSGSGTLISVNGSKPGVLIRQGDVNCSGASSGIDDIVAGDGEVDVSGSCMIDGNVWATDHVTVDGGTGVTGSIISNGATITRPVGGSIWSTGPVTLDWGSSVAGTITSTSLTATGSVVGQNVVTGGNLTATQTDFQSGINAMGDIKLRDLTLDGKAVGRRLILDGGVTLNGDADIYGRADATAGWASSAKNVTATVINFTGQNRVTGTRTIRSTTSVPASAITQNPATPNAPLVPDWIDFDYDRSDWDGFEEVVMSGDCDVDQLRSKLASKTGPTVVNGLGCNNNGVVIGGDDKVALNRNVAIIANKFDLGGSGGFTSTDSSRLWLVVPDAVKPLLGLGSTRADCKWWQDFTLDGGFSFTDSISTMIYSPCRVELASSTVLKGQIYAGEVKIAGDAELRYVKVGLPGVNLDTGEDDDGGLLGLPDLDDLLGIGSLGELEYYRDIPEPTVG